MFCFLLLYRLKFKRANNKQTTLDTNSNDEDEEQLENDETDAENNGEAYQNENPRTMLL